MTSYYKTKRHSCNSASIHIAQSHLSSPIAESSKIVPTLTENCLRQARQVHISRVLRNDSFLPWQRGHSGPFGHLALETASRYVNGSEKYRMASCKWLLSFELNRFHDSTIPLESVWSLNASELRSAMEAVVRN